MPAGGLTDKRGMGRGLGRQLRALLWQGLRPIVDWMLPPRCPGCGTVVGSTHSFCLGCWQALDFLSGPACARCAEPLPLALYADTECGACLADPPAFTATRVGVAYGSTARTLALKLKYGRRPGVALTMAGPMRRAGAALLDGALVVPVPLHRWRLWSRGYNQAALLARAVVKGVPADLAVDLLQRRRATPLLRGLNPGQRARAVAGAFAINPARKTALHGRRVVLVDDVFTTGATLRACARVLMRGGAADVAVLCWARALR